MAKKNIFDIKRGFLSLTILVFSFIVTLIFGIIGYHNEYAIDLASKHPLIAHWCDVTYSTFRLFSLSGISSVDMNQHWAISVARLSAQSTVFSSIALATIFSIGSWIRSNILIRFYKEHYVVIGMNKESYTLVNDLLKNNEKVILIHDDESINVDIEQLKKNGVAIIHESITSLKTLLKAAISNSKAIIAISDNDLVNLSVMQTIIDSSITDKITCYARLDNDISYKLFEPGAYYSIENIKALSTTLEINTFLITLDSQPEYYT